MRPPTPDEAWLAQRLQALVDVLQAAGSPIPALLFRAAAGREVLLVLDDAVLHLQAEPESPQTAVPGRLGLVVTPGPPPSPLAGLPCLSTRAVVLREVMDGAALLDAVVADARLDLRAPLPQLLAFHELVQAALALAPRHAALRAHWAGFLDAWPALSHEPAPSARLDHQAARHGSTTRAVPASVQQGRCIDV